MLATEPINKQMNVRTTRYVVITPVRDEEEHIAAVIDCMAKQTVRPAEWVIVNDGSTDRTGEILDQSSKQYPWMRVVHRPNRGFRKAGGGVVEAFYDGYKTVNSPDWEFIAKFDGDLTFAPDYFEKCFAQFEKNPKLGIGGGEIYHELDGEMKLEKNPKFHVRGATKIYRRNCWEAIEGLYPAPGWDTVDEVKANMLGWQTYAFPELRLHHHRFTGMADGRLKTCLKRGMVCYVSGYHPAFVVISSISRVRQKPYLIGSIATLYGYLKAGLTRSPKIEDPRYRTYIRSQQLRRLLGKPSIWK
jgi:poly-beta-1,6-N-acetyl-D-glucosamine synthase